MTNDDRCCCLSSGCHITPEGVKGGLEGGCACLPGLGTTLSLLTLFAVNWACVLGAGALASFLWWLWVVGDDRHCVCHCVLSASLLHGGCSLFWMVVGGWVTLSTVVVGRKKRCGSI